MSASTDSKGSGRDLAMGAERRDGSERVGVRGRWSKSIEGRTGDTMTSCGIPKGWMFVGRGTMAIVH